MSLRAGWCCWAISHLSPGPPAESITCAGTTHGASQKEHNYTISLTARNKDLGTGRRNSLTGRVTKPNLCCNCFQMLCIRAASAVRLSAPGARQTPQSNKAVHNKVPKRRKCLQMLSRNYGEQVAEELMDDRSAPRVPCIHSMRSLQHHGAIWLLLCSGSPGKG